MTGSESTTEDMHQVDYGYCRLFLFLVSLCFSEPIFILIYFCSAVLDVFDGYAARKLNQVSAFGAWIDVLIDNTQRGYLWASISQFGCFVSCIEWTTLCCSHSYGQNWKDNSQIFYSKPLPFVELIAKNGFRSILGRFVLFSIHGLPVALYIMQNNLLDLNFYLTLSVVFSLVIGRVCSFLVEMTIIIKHVQLLLYRAPDVLHNE